MHLALLVGWAALAAALTPQSAAWSTAAMAIAWSATTLDEHLRTTL